VGGGVLLIAALLRAVRGKSATNARVILNSAHMSQTTRWLLRGLALLALASTACVGLWFVFMFPGGVRPTYGADDDDLLLTYYARTAKPVIAAVDQYGHEHGAYPADLAAVATCLPSERITPGTMDIRGWN
jgi:hypothetical protein